MAINFLNNVNFNSIQVQDIVIENFTTAGRGAGVLGQMYFDTTLDTMMQFVANDGTGNAGYIEIGTTSGVESLTVGNATVNTGDVNTGLVLSAATGVITVTPKIYGGTDKVGMVPTGGTANKYLDGTGAWIDVTTGDIESVNEATASNLLGINITTPLGPNPTVGLDIVGRDSLGGTAAAGDQLLIYDLDVAKNKKVTVENLVGGYETTYTLPVVSIAGNNARISLTQNNATVDSTVTLIGTAGRIALSSSPNATAGTITVDMPTNVEILGTLETGGKLEVSGTALSTFAGQVQIVGATAGNANNAVTLGQLNTAVAGIGVFQGGYNVATNTPALTGGSNVALDQGDFFVVTTGGTFFTVTLEIGDFIFAAADITASSSPAVSAYTIVKADANLAGLSADEPGAIRGVAGFDSAYFTADQGWISLNRISNPNGAKQTLDNGGNASPVSSPVKRTFLNNLTTFEIDLAASSLFGSGAFAENVTAEVTQNVSPYQTVYADVTRSGSAEMSIIFVGNVAVDVYRVLLTHI